MLFLGIALVYALWGWDGSGEMTTRPTKAHPVYIGITAGISALFFLFVSAWTVGRVESFCAPTFDFGIFAQMFYSMKSNGLPVTTLERDSLLSHFRVHVSPIYYLMLPLYTLIPHPATLQVMQAAVLASAVVPLWLLGKHHGLSGCQRLLLCSALLFYPALAGGAAYDLHENCFLAPLLLWLFLGIDRRSLPLTLLTAVLTLAVKEDAAVYVAIIALWMMIRALLHADHREVIGGTLLFALSLGYFLLTTNYLATVGDGVMSNRYQNLMAESNDSLFSVVVFVLSHPMKALFECVDPEKLSYVGLTLAPLLGLPLLTRRYER
jgi:uncharacterized membrane protein